MHKWRHIWLPVTFLWMFQSSQHPQQSPVESLDLPISHRSIWGCSSLLDFASFAQMLNNFGFKVLCLEVICAVTCPCLQCDQTWEYGVFFLLNVWPSPQARDRYLFGDRPEPRQKQWSVWICKKVERSPCRCLSMPMYKSKMHDP